MTQLTNYKHSFSGSMGAGMKSLFGGGGRRFYELEHRTTTKMHRAGEVQKVIVDQIEMGRGSQCGVRYGEDCPTVSRKHAAIVKDGNGWKLVQLSTTNSTYLNGRKIEREWYLQNGDEIQLSTGGPKIGFLVKEGAGSLVKSINLTARLSLFRQQALRPYKRVLAITMAVLALAIVGGGLLLFNQGRQLDDAKKQLAMAAKKNQELEKLMKAQDDALNNQSRLVDSLKRLPPKVVVREKVVDPSDGVGIAECNPFVYHITQQINLGGDWYDYSFGTGFQLENGKFVTARHVVSTYYSNDYAAVQGQVVFREGLTVKDVYLSLLINTMQQLGKLEVRYICESPNDRFVFTQNEVHDYGGNMDRVAQLGLDINDIPAGTSIRFGASEDKDWAYINRNVGSGLKFGREESTQLKQGTQLFILGYPGGHGKGNPYLSKAVVSQNSIDQEHGGVIMAANYNSIGGNSGGPVLIRTDEGWKVIAILSGRNPDVEKARYVPISVIPQ